MATSNPCKRSPVNLPKSSAPPSRGPRPCIRIQSKIQPRHASTLQPNPASPWPDGPWPRPSSIAMARAAGSNSPWPWRPDRTGPVPPASPWPRRPIRTRPPDRTEPPPSSLTMAPADKSASKTPAMPLTLRNYCCRTPCGRRAIGAVGGAVVAVASAGSVPPVPTAAGTGEGRRRGETAAGGLRWRCRQSRNSREPRSRLGVGDSHGIGGGIIGADADAVVRGGRHERRSTTGMTRREPAGAGEAKRRRQDSIFCFRFREQRRGRIDRTTTAMLGLSFAAQKNLRRYYVVKCGGGTIDLLPNGSL